MDINVKIFELNVNYVYEETLSEFVNNNGICSDSTFFLIHWDYITTAGSNFENTKAIDETVIYKCYVLNYIKLISKFLVDRNCDTLKKLYTIVGKRDLFSYYTIYTLTAFEKKLKNILVKKMISILNDPVLNTHSSEFLKLLHDDGFKDQISKIGIYSNEDFFKEICAALKKALFVIEKPLLKTITTSYEELSGGQFNETEISNSLAELIESKLANQILIREVNTNDTLNNENENKPCCSKTIIDSNENGAKSPIEDPRCSIDAILNKNNKSTSTYENGTIIFKSPIMPCNNEKNVEITDIARKPEVIKYTREIETNSGNDEIIFTKEVNLDKNNFTNDKSISPSSFISDNDYPYQVKSFTLIRPNNDENVMKKLTKKLDPVDNDDCDNTSVDTKYQSQTFYSKANRNEDSFINEQNHQLTKYSGISSVNEDLSQTCSAKKINSIDITVNQTARVDHEDSNCTNQRAAEYSDISSENDNQNKESSSHNVASNIEKDTEVLKQLNDNYDDGEVSMGVLLIDESSRESMEKSSRNENENEALTGLIRPEYYDVSDKPVAKYRKIEVENDSWTSEQCARLVYFVQKHGNSIVDLFKNYFPEKTGFDLYEKYQFLKTNNLLEEYEKRSELINETEMPEIVKEEPNWSENEATYLVLGVLQYGLDWKKILTTYRKNFHQNRVPRDLQLKYYLLNKNPETIQYFMDLAKLMVNISKQ